MITLKEAFKLCRINDGEVIHLCDSVENARCWSWPMTGREVRNKYDMRNTMVTAIIPHCSDFEFNGFTFILRRTEKVEKEIIN